MGLVESAGDHEHRLVTLVVASQCAHRKFADRVLSRSWLDGVTLVLALKSRSSDEQPA